jgi:hypothetical protein
MHSVYVCTPFFIMGVQAPPDSGYRYMTTTGKIIIFVSIAVSVLSLSSVAVLRRAVETTSPQPKPRVDMSIRIAVLNGCGRAGLAGMFAEKLREMGFDVVNGMGENADSFEHTISFVVDRKGDGTGMAKVVADALGIQDIVLQHADDPYLIEDVAVVLGRDWHTLLDRKEE